MWSNNIQTLCVVLHNHLKFDEIVTNRNGNYRVIRFVAHSTNVMHIRVNREFYRMFFDKQFNQVNTKDS